MGDVACGPVAAFWRQRYAMQDADAFSFHTAGGVRVLQRLIDRGTQLVRGFAMTEETLFQEALARSPDERAAFLALACAGQPELLAAVKALLAAHEQTSHFWGNPPADPGPAVDAAPAQASGPSTGQYTPEPEDAPSVPPATAEYRSKVGPGLIIAGRYTLLEKIGEGGMGEVWVARQTEPVKRKVALKLIKTGMDSRAVLARFEHERQALALMEHPNIARVLDGGVTPSGQPFFAMELVNGLPLNRFCDGGKLTPRQRLELFVPICQAVQHAHQKGIVHRDLKPANILVTLIDGRPVPKVIDFGVAKATAGKLTDESLSTQFGAVVGTLAYMSPEQAALAGEDIDTRADIYSLGVILYELLTGLRPFDGQRLKKAALTEMIRIITEEEPSRPSTRLSTAEALASLAASRQTEPRRLMAMLRGELDWVIMKCLQKQRELRYATANGLARDIQRFLANEPVEARPPSVGYRLKKFVRRHRGAVLAATLIAFAVLAGVIGVALQWREAVYQRNQAEAARAQAENNARIAQVQRKVALDAVGQMVTTVRTELLKKPGLQDVLKKVLQIAQASLDQIAQNPLVDISLNDTTRAQVHDATARLHRDLGDTPAALQEFTRAADLYRAILAKAAEGPEKQVVMKNLVIVLISLGQTSLRTGSPAEARSYYDQAHQILGKLDNKTAQDYRKLLIELSIALGVSTVDRRPREARENYLAALRMAQELTDQEAKAAGFASDETRATLQRLHLLVGAADGRLRDAKARAQHYAQALTIARELLQAQPADNRRKTAVARAHELIGDSLLRTNQAAAAAKEFTTAAKLCQEIADSDPKNVDAQADLARLRYSQGLAAERTGDKVAAGTYFQDSSAIRSKRVHLKSETYAQRDLMMSLARVGSHHEAVALAEIVQARLAKDPGALLDIACCYAVCSTVVAADGAEKDTHARYVATALAALKQALDAGYGDKVNLETEPDLDAIRSRAEFQALVGRLPEA
jgi:serine/threonine protein kinase